MTSHSQPPARTVDEVSLAEPLVVVEGAELGLPIAGMGGSTAGLGDSGSAEAITSTATAAIGGMGSGSGPSFTASMLLHLGQMMSPEAAAGFAKGSKESKRLLLIFEQSAQLTDMHQLVATQPEISSCLRRVPSQELQVGDGVLALHPQLVERGEVIPGERLLAGPLPFTLDQSLPALHPPLVMFEVTAREQERFITVQTDSNAILVASTGLLSRGTFNITTDFNFEVIGYRSQGWAATSSRKRAVGGLGDSGLVERGSPSNIQREEGPGETESRGPGPTASGGYRASRRSRGVARCQVCGPTGCVSWWLRVQWGSRYCWSPR